MQLGITMVEGQPMPETTYHVKLKRICFLVTRKCNLWCKMCDYRGIHIADKDLSLEEIGALIRYSADMGLEWLDITGGEPMVRKDIYDIIATAKSHNIRVSMCSNGTLIGQEEAGKLVESGLTAVVISLEGFEELNDRLRGRGNYQKALQAIRSFKKYSDRMGDIKAGVIISRYNYQQIYDFTRFLFEEVGITAISFNPFTKWMLHHQKHNQLDDFIITPDLLPALKMELDKIVTYSADTVGRFPDAGYFNKIPDYFAGKSLVPGTGCTQPLHICGIESNGLVYPCLMEHIPAGNIKELSLPEIIAGRKYQDTCRRAIHRQCEGCLSACYERVHSAS
jgi:MoaA/NifB/PqqE/SkfB family radical SAM enzyme